MANGFERVAKDHKDIKQKTNHFKIEKFVGETFSGSFLQFDVDGGVTQNIFMIGEVERIRNGQFTGTNERWAEAVLIIKKLERNA